MHRHKTQDTRHKAQDTRLKTQGSRHKTQGSDCIGTTQTQSFLQPTPNKELLVALIVGDGGNLARGGVTTSDSPASTSKLPLSDSVAAMGRVAMLTQRWEGIFKQNSDNQLKYQLRPRKNSNTRPRDHHKPPWPKLSTSKFTFTENIVHKQINRILKDQLTPLRHLGLVAKHSTPL